MGNREIDCASQVVQRKTSTSEHTAQCMHRSDDLAILVGAEQPQQLPTMGATVVSAALMPRPSI